jgi:tetratricopeptide (TPR) repeat protein
LGRIKTHIIPGLFSSKIIPVLLFILFFCTGSFAQLGNEDIYYNVVDAKNDSVRINNLIHNLNVSIRKKEYNITDQCYEELFLTVARTGNKATLNRLVVSIERNYTNTGNYKRALDYFFKLKDAAEKAKMYGELGGIFDAIGVIYWFQGDFKNALEFYNAGIKSRGDKATEKDLAGSYNNIGLVYRQTGDYKKAIEYYTRSLQMCIRSKDLPGAANAYNNIGALYQIQKDYYKALYYNEKSLVLRKEAGDSVGIAISLGNIGIINFEMGNTKEAESFLLRSFNISERLNDLEGVKEVSGELSKLYENENRSTEAFQYYKKYIASRDSLTNEASQQEALRKEMQFKFDQEEQKIAIETAAEKKRQQQYTYMVLLTLGIVLIFSFLLYRRFNLKKKQKSIIEDQKKTVEEKQKEITDSIHYARRIQSTLLPSDRYIDKILKKRGS